MDENEENKGADVDPEWEAWQALQGEQAEAPRRAGKPETHETHETHETQVTTDGDHGGAPASDPEEQPEEEAPEGPSADEIKAAEDIARRFKMPAAVRDQMRTADPAGFVKWANRLAGMQEGFDNQKQRIEELEGQLAARSEKQVEGSQQPGSPPDAGAGSPPRVSDDSADRESIREALADAGIPEEATDRVLAYMDARVQAIASRVPDGPPAEVMQLVDQVRTLMEAGARKELSGEFPGLQDPERYETVRSKAAEWIGSGQYAPTDIESAMRDAARLEFFDDAVEAARTSERNSRNARGRSKGQPSKSGSREANGEVIKGDPEDYAWRALENGETPEAIRASLGR